jgi:CheY-like chemotaxis protein
MIGRLFLVDDEDLFHLVFEDACSMLDITLGLDTCYSADEAEDLFVSWTSKPDCIFVDLNIIGSTFDGIELIRRINFEHGNGVVIGIISSSQDQIEINKARDAGAQFWIVKTDDIEPRLERFAEDYTEYVDGTHPFTVYND